MKENESEAIIAEKSLLSTMLYNEDMQYSDYKYIINHIPSKMFFSAECKTIYEIIINTYESVETGLLGTDLYRGKVVDLFDVETDFSKIYYITELETYYYTKTSYKYWVKQIQYAYFSEAYRYAETREDYELIAEEEDALTIDSEMQKAAQDADIILSTYEQRKCTAVSTPWNSVNEYVGSLQGGDMVVLAGSTGCGKTCFMLNLAVGLAKQGRTVDIFSLEMPKSQLVQRIVCSELGIDSKKFRTFQLTDHEKKLISDYINGEFKKLPINIYTKQRVSISEIERIEKKSNADAVFIDYLGLVEGDNKKSTYDKFSEISRTIKLMAMTTNKPVIALHQLNRDFASRENKEPQLSDLRDSGKIEQDADMIWFVYRPGLFNDSLPKHKLLFIAGKNRHGETGKVPLSFEGKYQRIVDTLPLEPQIEEKTVEEEGEIKSAKILTFNKTSH